MEYKVLYVLTVKCTTEKCEADLEAHWVTYIDEDFIYVDIRKWKQSALLELEVIEKEKDEIIVRIPFFIKEAALVWVRQCLLYIKNNGSRQLANRAKEEWAHILNPGYDEHWFTGGKKAEEWRDEMRKSIIQIKDRKDGETQYE
ncbi:hypothetical protein [Butyrivibrio fibrisolvens]|uniref:hypothetical protein n=1 Tax=Butyrivibrio fibrisolvens TaxID=831 RepID=UPI000410B354|nr:hypothetical protein [Butyrivibrio fibrisolvens]